MILSAISVLVMLGVVAVVVDSRLELRPEIVLLILRSRMLRGLKSLGHGMAVLGTTMRGTIKATNDMSSAIGEALENAEEDDYVKVLIGGYPRPPRDYEEELDYDEPRRCGPSCGHYDSINLCCWIVSGKGLFTEVSEGDTCRYGYTEGDY